jgi:RNA-directed DNA polymerase
VEDKGESRSEDVMNTASLPMDEWNRLPWKTIEKSVFKLQKRIYQAAHRGEVKTVHKLQRLLTKSWHACLLAVRRVTQDNQGKKTAGIDGVKSLPPEQRLLLARKLQRTPYDPHAQPVRRVWIPKPGKDEKRPLGIPVMEDRARQMLVKLALEPEWEAYFEPNSYGFRPGRSAHDAIEAIFSSIKQKAKYVLDADIAQCFDHISHEKLLQKLATFPAMRRVIRSWLKAGVMEGLVLTPTEEGTPQGGVVSPVLANIALHGLELTVVQRLTRRIGPRTNSRKVSPTVVRYADDFVVLDEDPQVIQQAQEIIAEWLKEIGLELKPSKTKRSHTLVEYEGNIGFHFLGFEIRQYPVGKTHTGRTTRGKQLGFKTIMKPSKKSVQGHLQEIKELLRSHKTAPQVAIIQHLTPVVRGWANYFSSVCSKRTFAWVDNQLYLKLLSWAKRRHRSKSLKWIANKYWHTQEGRWNFATPQGLRLRRHNETPIKRYIKVEGKKSPYDGNLIYWSKRLKEHPMMKGMLARLLKDQKGHCPWCSLFFKDGDLLEIDHIVPKSWGGTNAYTNLQVLHRHCHDQKHGTRNRSHVVEEPCEVKSLMHGSEDESGGRPPGLV